MMTLMPLPFDTDAEDQKLATIREREEEDVARILSEKYGFGYTDLTMIPINMDALRLLPEAKARETEAVVFDKNGKHLSLAIVNPNNPTLVKLVQEFEDDNYILEKFLISHKSLARAYDRYKDLSMASESEAGVFTLPKAELDELKTKLTSMPAFTEHLGALLADTKHAQTSKLFEEILAAAFAMNASDIHVEPEENDVRLRLRLDGLLMDGFTLDQHTYAGLASRIKLLSGLKLNVNNRAQDGRFSVNIGGSEVEIRTSLIPGGYGESIVLRILNPESIQVSFDSLGIHPKLLVKLEEEIKRPNGMLLTTGPTGSGKTTTLYTFLRHIHTPDIKIITIEDPIEYHLPGIVQTQIDTKEYTFASGLRSILRQDPDIIMVGEIRDSEVAETAVQAALTGHFVFSTLHTNNAAGTFPRLVDLGVDPKTFASAVTVAMAQRLVRTLNPEKKKQVPLEGEQRVIVEKILSTITDVSLLPSSLDMTWVPDVTEGDETGYKGRVGLYEAIFMDEELGEFLRDNPSEGDVAKHVERQGYLTMAQDGVIKALNGITSLEEVFRVVDLPRA
ncbi:MAG: pilB1 [Parcubacteria group bacterium]|nr:pilB1 [Parcubacteria group bacterium]